MKKKLRTRHVWWNEGYLLCDSTKLLNWEDRDGGISNVMSFVWKHEESPLDRISCEVCRSKVSEIITKYEKQRERNEVYSPTNPAPLDTPIGTLPLRIRVTRCFDVRGIFTIADVMENTDAELLRISNFGELCLQQTRAALADVGRPWSYQSCEEAIEYNKTHKK